MAPPPPTNGTELHVATDVLGLEVFRYDATTGIGEQEQGKLTAFPIETGAEVGDHYQNLPLLITLSGVYTDDPSFTTQALEAAGFIGSRTENGRELLRRLKRNAEILTIRTQRGTVYENMIILDWQDQKTPGSGATFRPTIRLKQIEFAATETTLIPDVGALDGSRTAENVRTEERPGVSGDSETGRQSPTEAEDQDVAPLRRAFGGVLGVAPD